MVKKMDKLGKVVVVVVVGGGGWMKLVIKLDKNKTLLSLMLPHPMHENNTTKGKQ